MINRPKNKKREQQAAAMMRQTNEQAVSEEVLKSPSPTRLNPIRIKPAKTKATSFRFPIEFIDELDAYQRSNDKNPTRKSKTRIIMEAVSEYMEKQ